MSDLVSETFGPGGHLSRAFDGYQPRSGQIKMATEVQSAMALGEHLVCEAPTGTGKSLAYLIPAIEKAVSTGSPVVICTANIALQEQIVGKDLPALAELLPLEFRFALAKGRGNYVCHKALDGADGKIPADVLEQVQEWIKDDDHDGSLSELGKHLPIYGQTRAEITTTSEECPGDACAYFHHGCYPQKAKVLAAEAHVIVSNYHMLFADLKVRQMTDGNVSVLPPFDTLVFDEAHKAADIARDFFGDELREKPFRRAAASLSLLSESALRAKIETQATAFFAALARYGTMAEAKPRLKCELPLAWEDLRDNMKLASKLYDKEAEYSEGNDRKIWNKKAGQASKLAQRLETMATQSDENYAYYIDVYNRALCSKMIHPAGVLNSVLWSKLNCSISTSATLSIEGRFSHYVAEMGLPDPMTIEVESPFDPSRALLVIDSSMPDPKDYQDYQRESVQRAIDIVYMAKGRTLILCTSRKQCDRIYEALMAERTGFKILKQGAAHERSKVVAEFKADESSVLVGTESFWAGVDVPGKSLSCVVIDRLPFATPDDPILDAMSATDPKVFFNVSVPRAVIQFKQGFGRLIRAVEDRGVVVVLDNRITKKSYGRRFIRSLPGVEVSRDVHAVSRFFQPVPEAVPAE